SPPPARRRDGRGGLVTDTGVIEVAEEEHAAGGRPIQPPNLGRIAAITGGAAVAPLLILTGLNFVEQFDRIAFAALAPEIRNAFHLSDVGISTIRAITGVTTLLAALPLGIASDRVRRSRLCVLAAVLWGSASILTGVVPALWLLYVVRLMSG